MKKRIFKIAGFLILSIIVLVTAGLSYVKLALPAVGNAPQLTVELTPKRIARGKYLAHHVAGCMSCHSRRDTTRFAMPTITGTLGEGGEKFDLGDAGIYYSTNLTPMHIGTWTDGELLRAITTGVSKDGHALFPLMPYSEYGQMAEEDIKSIIAYLRTLKPIKNDIQPSVSHFPMNFIIHTMPKKASFGSIPDKSNVVAYGKYLMNTAACTHCHTQSKNGQAIAGMEFAGGNKFPLPSRGIVHSANITPDTQTGIGKWSKEDFITRFKIYTNTTAAKPVKDGEFNTVMPWREFGGMTEEDLGAIYTYLQTVKPVNNSVQKFVSQKK